MKSKKILSAVMSAMMLSNMAVQTLPAGALTIPTSGTKRAEEKSDASEKGLKEAASGDPVFTSDASAVALGENTISEA